MFFRERLRAGCLTSKFWCFLADAAWVSCTGLCGLQHGPPTGTLGNLRAAYVPPTCHLPLTCHLRPLTCRLHATYMPLTCRLRAAQAPCELTGPSWAFAPLTSLYRAIREPLTGLSLLRAFCGPGLGVRATRACVTNAAPVRLTKNRGPD